MVPKLLFWIFCIFFIGIKWQKITLNTIFSNFETFCVILYRYQKYRRMNDERQVLFQVQIKTSARLRNFWIFFPRKNRQIIIKKKCSHIFRQKQCPQSFTNEKRDSQDYKPRFSFKIPFRYFLILKNVGSKYCL